MLDQYLDIKSIDPAYWGKCGWIFINSIALTYKPEFKDKYKLFIQQLPYILPCRTCGVNLTNNMDQLEDALESKESLLEWLLKIRNAIYIEQERPTKTLKDNINEIFSVKYSYTSELHTLIITILSVIILLILIFLFKKYH
jgi:hypothetical protein